MILLMTVLWLASLWAYTFVMTSALPGLTHLQALTLNGAGSAVSNLLPFGGAAGVALTFGMTKGWGFPTRPVVVYTLVTGIWNTLSRFLLPAAGIIALLVAGRIPDHRVVSAAWGGAISILVLIAVVAAALYWESSTPCSACCPARSARPRTSPRTPSTACAPTPPTSSAGAGPACPSACWPFW